MRLFNTDPLAIIDLPASNLHQEDTRLSIEFIVLHATAYPGKRGTGDSRLWLSRTSGPPPNQVSCHRLVRYGKLYKIVPDNLVAYTQGPACIDSKFGHSYNPNRICLSIEIENDNKGEVYSDIDLGLTADQCVEWIGAYGIIPIVYHMQIQGDKTDPAYFPRATFDRMVAERMKRYL